MRLTSPKREARYRQLLQAAVKVFARDGIDGASISDIAEEAKIAKGSLYLYFDSKEELCGDLVGYLFTFADDGPRLADDPRPLDRILAFCAELDQRARALGQDAALLLHMFGHSGKTADDQLARGVRQFMAESRFLIETLLANARTRGALPPEADIRPAAAALLALAIGVIHSRLASGPAADSSISVEAAVRVYMQGLGARIEAEV
jgi:TetR/AcrR family fatty acid metabolism transcriptional regulator